MFRLARRTSAPFVLIVVLLLALSPTTAGGSPGDLVVNGAQISLEGSYTYDNVFVKNGGRIVVGPLNKFLELRVTNTFLVDATSSVIANGLGIGPGDAPVYSYGDWIAGGGGAGYGGWGGQGDGWYGGGGPGGPSYGDSSNGGTITGSRGADGKFGGRGPGGGGGPGGRGGGRIMVTASAIQVEGRIEANGANGSTYQSGGGGGSGGGITLSGNQVTISGSVIAEGGNGGPGSYGGGGGAGGRITVLYGLLSNSGTLSAKGGAGGVSYPSWWPKRGKGEDGQSGSALFTCVDKFPPTTTATLSGVLGLNGWYTSNVQVTLLSVDCSGVAKTEYSFDGTGWNTYTAPFAISSEGTTTVYYRSSDNAGNAESTKTQMVKVDRTPPVVSISGPAVVLQGASASAVVTASDALSGLALDPSGTLALDTSEVGVHTLLATATDKAGNSTSASLTYTVWGVNGPFPPLEKSGKGTGQFKAGSTIPVKFQITDGANLITNAAGTVTIGSATAPFRWDATAQQYVANVKTGADSGRFPVTLAVAGVGSKVIATVDLR